MNILGVNGLSKTYPSFELKDVSFSVKEGSIMGFIGRNGAGKTTTLKSVLNIVHADGGQVRCFGLDMNDHEGTIRQRIGFAGGTAEYYKKKKIKDIMAVTKRFYENFFYLVDKVKLKKVMVNEV